MVRPYGTLKYGFVNNAVGMADYLASQFIGWI